MKDYTRDEKNVARERLPQPIKDFLASDELSKIYLGLQRKLKLDLRQLMAVSEASNLTLLGLESESALETNIHDLLHELSNEATRELVADINDRIFKEAKRRIRENITTSGEPWDATVLGTKEEYEKQLRSHAEPDEVYTARRARELKEEEENEKRALETEKNRRDTQGIPTTANAETSTLADEVKNISLPSKLQKSVSEVVRDERATPISGVQQISIPKLSPAPIVAPRQTIPQVSATVPNITAMPRIPQNNPQTTPRSELSAPSVSPQRPAIEPPPSSTPRPQVPPPVAPIPKTPPPRLKGDADPYRESVE